MPGEDIFWYYGVGLCLVLGLWMLVPFWRGRADALTAWNLLLLGSIVQVGVGCLEVYTTKMHWPELKWFEPNSHEVNWFLTGTTLFYVSLLLFHSKWRLPARLLQNRLTAWPDFSGGVVVFVLGICAATTAIMPVVQNIPFLREIAINFSHSALAIGVTFATVFWLKNRVSPFALLLLVTAFGLAALEAMISFAGRRLLLTVAFGPLAAVYWLSWRYWSRSKLVALFSVLSVGLLVVSAFYATFRHMTDERTAANVVARVKAVTMDDVSAQLDDMYHYLAQYSAHYSMLAIRVVDDGRVDVVPLDALRQIATYPIPRSLWAGKPRDTLMYLSTDVLHMPYKTNWGVGIAGQAYHDGGFLVLILYAALATLMVKVIDLPLAREPDNPFLLAALASSSAHIVAWPRGSLSAMTLNILESLFLVIVLGYVCRSLFGTARPRMTPEQAWLAAGYYPPQHS